MADVADRIRKELEARIEQLRPLVAEFERLQRAAAALARATPAPRQRRAKVPPAPRPTRPRTPSPTRRAATARRRPAPRGQTQARVLAALRAAPGSTTATVAEAAGIPANAASATISRLVRQGRVRHLDEGGYALVEAPVGPDATPTAAATADAASEPPGAQAPPPPGAAPAR